MWLVLEAKGRKASKNDPKSGDADPKSVPKKTKQGPSSAVKPQKDCYIRFRDYNLINMGIPKEALPQEGKKHLGAHGYTVCSSNGGAP